MTRAELHNITGFHPASVVATTQHIRENMKRRKGDADATALINNEGWMNGYLDAIEDMLNAVVKQPEKTEKPPMQPYSQPQFNSPQFDSRKNQNKA